MLKPGPPPDLEALTSSVFGSPGTSQGCVAQVVRCGSLGVARSSTPEPARATHSTAFHGSDTAFAHLHPSTEVNGGHGGPELPFNAELPTSGNWRLFPQFQTAGKLRTAVLTLNVD
ncbi:hypothetical protein ACFRCI_19345 [Streptomyces sp. NPDC056638]|uniref:hypothetical protein n=1 Tax=Streptomyces sp. NPDC056638 TaxID=3345887 RepID=UPI0036CD8992